MTQKTFAMELKIKRDCFVPGVGLPRARRLSLIFACR